jgi:hypothetical protein
MFPEHGTVHSGVRMPINVLTAWSSVQIKDGINAIGTEL